MPWDTSSVPCGAGVAARFLLGRRKRKWQLVNSLVLFTLHPAPFLVLSCLSLSALPISTPGLQKKRALPCRQLLTAFYLCTPFSWIKNNSFLWLVFTCSQDLYLKWSEARAWLKHTEGGEPFSQVGKGRVAGTGQARNRQQTCHEVGGSHVLSSFPAARWIHAICGCYCKALQNDGQGLAWSNPGLAKGPGMCCLLRFTLQGGRWAAAAIIWDAYYIFHMPTSYSSLHTLFHSLWMQKSANPVPSVDELPRF